MPLAVPAILSLTLVAQNAPALRFEDVTEAAGLFGISKSCGSAWVDLNGDGWPDLWASRHAAVPDILRNRRDGKFLKTRKRYFPKMQGKDFRGTSFADYDNDGDPDGVTTCGADNGVGENPKLFWRDDQRVFTDIADQLGLTDPPARGRTVTWLDWNGDGVLDLLMANKPREDGRSPTSLFLQKEGKFALERTFPDAGETFDPTHGQLVDLDGDGKLELAILTTDKVTLCAVGGGPLPYDPGEIEGAVDAACVDLDNNGKLELILGRREHGCRLDSMRLKKDELVAWHLIPPALRMASIGSFAAGDLDNDGDIDLFLVCTEFEKNTPDVLLENRGLGAFQDVMHSGCEGPSEGIGESVSVCDYDCDGRLDLFVQNGYGNGSQILPAKRQLFHNIGGVGNHWVELDLVGTKCNRDAIGARVTVTCGKKRQLRLQNGGVHSFAQDFPRVHVGLAKAETIDKLEVDWPDGSHQEFADVAADKIYVITQGAEAPVVRTLPPALKEDPDDPQPKRAKEGSDSNGGGDENDDDKPDDGN